MQKNDLTCFSLKKLDLFLLAGQLVQKKFANMRKEIMSPGAFLQVQKPQQ